MFILQPKFCVGQTVFFSSTRKELTGFLIIEKRVIEHIYIKVWLSKQTIKYDFVDDPHLIEEARLFRSESELFRRIGNVKYFKEEEEQIG